MSRISMVLAALMAIMTFIWHPTEAEAQVKDGLAGHWTFDKKDTDDKEAKDAIGKHHGVIMGKPQIVEGKAKEALSFDGKADYVVMGAVTEGQDLTYAMWVKVEKLPATPQVIIWDDDPQGGGDSWLELLPDGKIQTQRGGDGFGVFSSNTPIKPGAWTHITFVADGKNDKKVIYLNGKSDAESGGKIMSRTTRSHIVVAVGHDRNAFIKPFYFEGLVDEVSIHNRALKADEVKKNIIDPTAVEAVGKLAISWGIIKTEDFAHRRRP